jgi:uncharacterized protein with ParB-like and HNH nuclease domain/predicted transport protein
MKAKEANFLRFLHGAKQFIIPIYQRTYSWQLKQCEQLFHDLIRINSDKQRPGHFIGSIVYFEEDIHTVSEVPQLLVIDGQQRLTTLNLLIAAMVEFLKENPGINIDTNHKKLKNYYLVNSEENNDLYYKLVLTKKDKETLKAIVQSQPMPKEFSPRVKDNYAFFKSRINSDNIRNIYDGIQKLFIVDVALERGKDNPQLIFESLNSTGLELSQADLIRNYVLMGQEPKTQKHLYETYWFPMEQNFGNAYASIFDGFMRHYLTVKTGQIPKINEVYEKYKEYAQRELLTKSTEDIVADIYNYSNYYVRMSLFHEPDKELKVAFRDLSVLRVDVAYPMLLELYNDYQAEKLSKEDFTQIVRMIESYVFRRVICGIPTNSLNKTFARFIRGVNKDQYLESVKAEFLLMTSYRRFPSNSEMEREMLIKDVYNFRSRNYLLRKLENQNRKEKVNIEEYTIEHILPQNQNLSDYWKRELGEHWEKIQEKYLHTIGNLTLTGYNSELSDRSFLEKKKMEGGFLDSPLRLNRNVANKERWNEESILSRATELIQKAIRIWQIPDLEEDVLNSYREAKNIKDKTEYDLDHYQLEPTIFQLYSALKKRILNIDSSVTEEYKKLYIAFKTTTNFVDIVPQKKRLRLSLNLGIDEINDPKELCKDVSKLGRWGNGDVEVGFSSLSEIEDVMDLIHQSYEKHSEYVLDN